MCQRVSSLSAFHDVSLRVFSMKMNEEGVPVAINATDASAAVLVVPTVGDREEDFSDLDEEPSKLMRYVEVPFFIPG